jgi:hypothetical protein
VTASIFSLCISSSRFFICLRSLARRFWNHILTYKRKEMLVHSSRGTWYQHVSEPKHTKPTAEDMSHGKRIWSPEVFMARIIRRMPESVHTKWS